MGSERLRFCLGGAVAIGAIFLLQQHVPGLGSDRVSLDPQREWDKAKVPHKAATPLERRLGEVATLAAGRSVQVRCEDFSDGTPVEPGGVVQFRGNEPAEFARIRPDFCTDLSRFPGSTVGASSCLGRDSCTTGIFAASQAITVLAHESRHLSGIRDEAVTQCYAMQSVPRLARALGATRQDAQALAALEYVVGYARMPSAYRSRECRPNGKLDLAPDTARWP
jgi:hypothetical protein